MMNINITSIENVNEYSSRSQHTVNIVLHLNLDITNYSNYWPFFIFEL